MLEEIATETVDCKKNKQIGYCQVMKLMSTIPLEATTVIFWYHAVAKRK